MRSSIRAKMGSLRAPAAVDFLGEPSNPSQPSDIIWSKDWVPNSSVKDLFTSSHLKQDRLLRVGLGLGKALFTKKIDKSAAPLKPHLIHSLPVEVPHFPCHPLPIQSSCQWIARCTWRSKELLFYNWDKKMQSSSEFVWRGHATSSAERKLSFL